MPNRLDSLVKRKGDEMMEIFDEMLENNTDKKKLQPTILLKQLL
jgi:hypothetical protein